MENLLSPNENDLFPVHLARRQRTGTLTAFVSTGTAESSQKGGPGLLSTVPADLTQHTHN